VKVILLVNNKSAETIAEESRLDAESAAEARRRRALECDRRLSADMECIEGGTLGRKGSKHRHQYTVAEKVRLVEVLDSIHGNGELTNKIKAFEEDARARGAPYTTVLKWAKSDERRKIYAASSKMYAKKLLRIDKTSRRIGRYAAMEKELYRRFADRRAHARKTSARWLVHTARHLMRTSFAEGLSPDKPFKAGPGWLRRFARRWRICRRKKTNCKNSTWEETMPVLQRYFRSFRRRLRSSGWAPGMAGASTSTDADLDTQKWGQYLPHLRLNVDQVPLPFINDMDYTYEEKCAKRVAINQYAPALAKRQCTAQVCFRPVAPPEVDGMHRVVPQPKPSIIFRGTGKHVSQEEKDAYPDDLVVLWQPKAWVDRPMAQEWVTKVLKPMVLADRAAGVPESSRYLLKIIWMPNASRRIWIACGSSVSTTTKFHRTKQIKCSQLTAALAGC